MRVLDRIIAAPWRVDDAIFRTNVVSIHQPRKHVLQGPSHVDSITERTAAAGPWSRQRQAKKARRATLRP